MFSLKQIILPSLAVFLIGLPVRPVQAELSPREINSIARQTTVLIAPGLTPELRRELEENRNNPLKPGGNWNPGSGVIVARQGNKYYVLTVAHNFFQRHLDTKELWPQSGGIPFYGIRTWDGKIHKIDGVDDGRGCPLRGSPEARTLIRFGCRDFFVPGKDTVDRQSGQGQDNVKGIDLAVISFVSQEEYAVAPLGDVSSLKVGDRVYISGWPDPEQERREAGQPAPPVSRRERRLAWGPVTRKLNPEEVNQGYSIFYTDSNGRVVGNHGIGSRNKKLCGSNQPASTRFESRDSLGQAVDANSLSELYSRAQQVNKALDLIRQVGLNLPFNFAKATDALIKRGLQEIQTAGASSGRVDVDAIADASSGSFEDPNDVIPDIYKEFSSFSGLGSRLRDNPSGGCGTILLGEPCE
jgi:serine protease Do